MGRFRYTIAGALPGIALSGIGLHGLAGSIAESQKDMKSDLVDARKVVARYAPDAYVATSKSDIDQIDISDRAKKRLKDVVEYVKDGGNAASASTGGHNIIISPEKVNRSLIGHEIGHISDRSEKGAWEKSPFQDDESKRIAKNMLKTYRSGNLVTMGGIAAGAGAATAPMIMKALGRL